MTRPVRVAINGFGRIGRLLFRVLTTHPSEFEVVAINDLGKPQDLANLVAFDSVQGRSTASIDAEGGELSVDGKDVRVVSEKDPRQLPWSELEVDVVVESTGRFTSRQADDVPGYDSHLNAGAGRVIVSAPARNADATIVVGVNDDTLSNEHRCISNASCTTNCLAPMAMLLDQAFGIDWGVITTVHAYTSDQALSDGLHSDIRRGRAAALNIIPTSTGAASAVGLVVPALAGRMKAISLRVPVAAGSVTDFVAKLRSHVAVDEVNQVMREAAAGELQGILSYTEAPIVSSDIVGNPHSCIFDGSWTTVLEDHVIKVLGWYDNEWGYANRTAELIRKWANG